MVQKVFENSNLTQAAIESGTDIVLDAAEDAATRKKVGSRANRGYVEPQDKTFAPGKRGIGSMAVSEQNRDAQQQLEAVRGNQVIPHVALGGNHPDDALNVGEGKLVDIESVIEGEEVESNSLPDDVPPSLNRTSTWVINFE